MSKTHWISNISCSETFTDHITSHSFSFGCCAFEIKTYRLYIKLALYKSYLVDFSGRWMYDILKSADVNAEIIIIMWMYSILSRLKKHCMLGVFFYTMNHFTMGIVWILCGPILKYTQACLIIRSSAL